MSDVSVNSRAALAGAKTTGARKIWAPRPVHSRGSEKVTETARILYFFFREKNTTVYEECMCSRQIRSSASIKYVFCLGTDVRDRGAYH